MPRQKAKNIRKLQEHPRIEVYITLASTNTHTKRQINQGNISPGVETTDAVGE
jgi:hypothetical protein